MVVVNGQEKDIAGMNLLEYLQTEGYQAERIAIEYNGEILPKRAYKETTFVQGDKVEIVHFVGGG
ncbi:MAG: sulfur carrier protein ThiS [Anaerovoracaceae bacterium]